MLELQKKLNTTKLVHNFFSSYHDFSICDDLASYIKNALYSSVSTTQVTPKTSEQVARTIGTINGHTIHYFPEKIGRNKKYRPKTLTGIKGFHKFTYETEEEIHAHINSENSLERRTKNYHNLKNTYFSGSKRTLKRNIIEYLEIKYNRIKFHISKIF